MLMHFRIKRDLFVAPNCCTVNCSQRFTDYATRSGIRVDRVTRTRIRVSGVNFGEILIKGKEISSSKRAIRGIQELTE